MPLWHQLVERLQQIAELGMCASRHFGLVPTIGYIRIASLKMIQRTRNIRDVFPAPLGPVRRKLGNDAFDDERYSIT